MKLKPWPKNPRRHEVEALAERMRRFGFGAPALVRRADGELIAGHGRTAAAKLLIEQGPRPGDTADVRRVIERGEIPARVMDLSKTEAHALALADNNGGEWTDELKDVLLEIRDEGGDLSNLGWSADELADLMGDEDAGGEPGTEAEPPPKKAVSVRGAVYHLGPHRLACGDATDRTLVDKLLGDEVPDLVLTDPPYSSGGWQDAGKHSSTSIGSSKAHKIQRDNLSSRGFLALMGRVLANVEGAERAYMFTDWRMWGWTFDALESSGWPVRSMIVWNKDEPGMGFPWRSTHELVAFASKIPADTSKAAMKNARANVITCSRSGNEHHPTEKPVPLVRDLLAPIGGCRVVYDPFGGSGTTLIACADTKRVARLVEVDPRYCDVIRRRWTKWATEAGENPGPGALKSLKEKAR